MNSFSSNTIEREFSDSLIGLLPKDRCEGHGLVVAFSGGCDSLALLSLCVAVLGPADVFPVYVNHNLRSEEELGLELSLNERNCRELGVGLEVCTLERGGVLSLAQSRKCGVEEAARILRYEALEAKRLEHYCTAVATAHHRQDQIETVAMRLCAGSPVGSLRGISRYDGERHLVRPLLPFGRPELERYLQEKGLVWSCDSTNSDSSYSRNRFRNELLPDARLKWPLCDEHLLSLSRAASKVLDGMEPNVPDIEKGEGVVWVDADAFCGMQPANRTMVLFRMWDGLFGDVDLPMTLVMRALKAIENGNDCRIGANGGVFSLYNGRLGLFAEGFDKGFDKGSAFVCTFDPHEDQSIDLPYGLTFRSGRNAIDATCGMDRSRLLFMDADAFKGTPCLRFAREGDSIRLKGGRRMVRRLLQDMKVPSGLRSRVPVIEDEDGICAVFAGAFGGVDRICVKFRSSLAPNNFTLYIVDYTESN